jgi:hypothetical protein
MVLETMQLNKKKNYLGNMGDEYLTRKYQTGDEEQIVDLLNEVFEGWPKFDLKCSPLEHWRWKYQENYIKEKLIAVSEKDSKIIGVSHHAIQNIKILNEVVLSSTGGDVAVLKEYRRHGIRNANLAFNTSLRSKAGIKISQAITSNPIVIDMFERSPDYQRLPLDIVKYVRIMDINRHISNNPADNSWVMKIGFQVLDKINKFKNIVNTRESTRKDVQKRDVEWFNEDVNRFWDKIKGYYNFITQSDQQYLNWRYCDSRSGPHTIKAALENGEIVGFVVLMLNRYRVEYPIGTIIELLTLPGREDVVESLILESINFFEERDVNIVTFLSVNQPQLNRILEKYGFLNSRVPHHIFYKIFGEDPLKSVLAKPLETLHFNWGSLI